MRAASLIVASVCTLALACTAGNTWNTSSGGVQEQPFPTTNGPRTADQSAGVTTGNLPASATTTPGFAGNAAGICDELASVASKCGEQVTSDELAQCKGLLGRCPGCGPYYRCALAGLKCKNGKVDDDDASKDCKGQIGSCFTCLGGSADVSTGDAPTPSSSGSGASGSSGSSSSFADAGK